MRLGGRTRRLTGERIELRRHVRENYPLYSEWYGDPEIWHLTSWASAPLSRVAVERLFEDRESSATDDSFAIHHTSRSGAPVGVISLINISKNSASADLSVIVGSPEDRARGYGTEAIGLLLDYAFEDLGLSKVGLSVFEFNGAALSTYEKLGFHEESRLKKAIRRGDENFDAILMSIPRSEWRAPGG